MITKVIEIFYQKHQEYQQILKDLINHNSNNATQLKTLKSLEIYDRLYQEWQEANQYLDLIINDKSYAKDVKGLKNTIKNITISMEKILVSRDHNQQISTIFLEIRSGAGGKESWLFNQDLCVMYGHYCEKNNLTCNIEYNTVNNSHITLKISGLNAKELLKYESGVHRVQRVPLTETQGRIHTSTSIVTIIEERPDLIIDLKPQDLRIDTMRSSGAGGQHVNTTDSAVRIVHLPTGIKAECQNDRSQHKNKEGAITQLKAKLAQYYHDQHSKDMSELRNQFSGLRSEKIRTYNFAQNRITDHRINLSLYNLDSCLKGELTKIIDKLNENQES